MFNPGDLVGFMLQDDWGELKLTEERGVVISCNHECGKAEVVWTEGHRGIEFFEDLKLIAYGRQND